MHGARPHGCRSILRHLARWGWAVALLVAGVYADDSLEPRRRSFAQPPEIESNADDDRITDKQLVEPLVDVVLEGNTTIQAHAIQQKIKSRKGRPVTRQEIQEDVASLLDTRWFFHVKPVIRMTDEGPILIYRLRERPMVRSVTFKGNKKIKENELRSHIGISVGHGFDVAANREAVARIRSLYREKGYHYAEVELEKGNDPNDREVVFVIVEGPKVKVWWIRFEGNQFCTDAVLRTKLATKNVILWYFGGDFDPDKISNDLLTLTEYYHNLGFFDVKVDYRLEDSEDKAWKTVVFQIEEGIRYKVRNIDLAGNEVLQNQKLWNKPKLKPGEAFNARLMGMDVKHMKDQYDELGRLFARVDPVPRFLDEPGQLDLVYEIDEDKPYRIGAINAHIRGDHPHTREDVLLNNVARWAQPGELANGRKLRMAQARIMGSNLWDQQEPPVFDIVKVDGKDYMQSNIARAQSGVVDEVFSPDDSESDLDRGFGHTFAPESPRAGSGPRDVRLDFLPALMDGVPIEGKAQTARPIQRVGSAASEPVVAARPVQPSVVQTEPSVAPTERKPARPGTVQFAAADPTPDRQQIASNKLPPAARRTSVAAPASPLAPEVYVSDPTDRFDPSPVIRAQSDDGVVRGQSIDRFGQPIPQNNMVSPSPQGNPYGDALRQPEPGFVDLNVDVTEGRTGRLMFGVGVNSNAGLVGSFVLQEDNFDILRPPRSWSDVLNGYAFRGAGQSFRLEAQPGTQVSRYMATWTDPFFMRTDFSLGVSGFFYQRFYNEWNEERVGGRVSLGYLLNEYWSAGGALRLENVDIAPRGTTPPADITDVRGGNLLSTGQVTLTRDTRDNSFIPSSGNLLEFSYEQAFGEFNYPKFEVTGSQLFTVYQRPDGFGKHIVHLQGQAGWTGSDTPVFERFYAGGYSSFRGFAFRGVSPTAGGYRVGGDFMMLGTAEYLVPITASDSVRVVVFSDFGTVEPEPQIEDFRVSAGFGFRLTIPAMGPAPLAFDFAWPITRAQNDDTQVFSFTVGFTR